MKAYLRRCQSAGACVVVVRRGDDQAGAIFIWINRLDGSAQLFGPAPAGFADSHIARRWVQCMGGEPVSASEAARYLERQMEVDPDLWVVEVEDRAGRHFLDDAVIED